MEQWECKWKSSLSFAQAIVQNDCVDPLNPRDAYYGGRTEVFKLYKHCKGDQKIGYIDVCSLYPAVSFQKSFLPTSFFPFFKKLFFFAGHVL